MLYPRPWRSSLLLPDAFEERNESHALFRPSTVHGAIIPRERADGYRINTERKEDLRIFISRAMTPRRPPCRRWDKKVGNILGLMSSRKVRDFLGVSLPPTWHFVPTVERNYEHGFRLNPQSPHAKQRSLGRTPEGPLLFLEPASRLELETCALRVRCSTY